MHDCAQSCLTLWDPTDWSPPGSSVHGVLQARILEWVTMPSSRGSSWPRGRTWVSCTGGRFFTTWATREALQIEVIFFNSSHLHVLSFLFSLMTEWRLFEGGLEVLGKTCPPVSHNWSEASTRLHFWSSFCYDLEQLFSTMIRNSPNQCSNPGSKHSLQKTINNNNKKPHSLCSYFPSPLPSIHIHNTPVYAGSYNSLLLTHLFWGVN